jgi:hypothetical protein
MPRSLAPSRLARSRHSPGCDRNPAPLVSTSADGELAARQSALQAEATALLDELDQSGVFAGLVPLEVTGSYISNLMCWRDLDVGLLVGPDCDPRDVLRLISRVIEIPGWSVSTIGTNVVTAAPPVSSGRSGTTFRSCWIARRAGGGSTCRCGYMIFIRTSLPSTRGCAIRSLMSSARRCTHQGRVVPDAELSR